jgi:hypothetical protein
MHVNPIFFVSKSDRLSLVSFQVLKSAVVKNSSILGCYAVKVKVNQSHYSPWTGPEGSSRLRLPDFKTIGTLKW